MNERSIAAQIPRVGDNAVTKKEMKQLRTYLNSTTRPSWHSSLPNNLGQKAHGKLKADQWRSAIEFDIPVAIAKLWNSTEDPARATRQQKLVDATFCLGEAIRWATLYTTSPIHAQNYTQQMVAYLTILKDLYPNLSWRPKHHAALHIGPFLLLFGPMPGWWMYVFERIIGILQRCNMNFKKGQLDLVLTSKYLIRFHFIIRRI